MNQTTELFGEPISTYISEQAVEDGVLVAITKRDLVTRSVWDFLAAKTPLDSKPPASWPVDMIGWFRAGSITQKDALKLIAKHGREAQQQYEQQVRDKKALALASGLIARDSRAAIRAEDAGEIFTLYAIENGEILLELAAQPRLQYQVMYLRPNELGGVTLMFPEDN